MSKYVAATFLSENSGGSVFCKNNSIHIAIAGEKVNLKNFWSGQWASNWTLNVSAGSVSLTGDIKVSSRKN